MSNTSQLVFVLSLISSIAWANEPNAPENYWRAHGYEAVPTLDFKSVPRHFSVPPGSLKWPVVFQDGAHTIANSYLQFQAYSGPAYFHGGCDLRVQNKEKIFAPVSGRLEAGHYGYTVKPDGSQTKHWMAWPKTGEALYFEVAIITDDGFRFELHHVDRTSLASDIVKLLDLGGVQKITAGTYIANTVTWPSGGYHHVHYNIYDPSGAHLNPEYYSQRVVDRIAPQVRAVVASMPDGKVMDFSNGQFTQRPDFFAIAVIDRKDTSVYDQPPVLVGVQFESSTSREPVQFFWDFRERLMQPGGFPAIWNLYVDRIRAPSGTYATSGGYGVGETVIRIPVPKNANGKFKIHVADLAGNKTEFLGSVP